MTALCQRASCRFWLASNNTLATLGNMVAAASTYCWHLGSPALELQHGDELFSSADLVTVSWACWGIVPDVPHMGSFQPAKFFSMHRTGSLGPLWAFHGLLAYGIERKREKACGFDLGFGNE